VLLGALVFFAGAAWAAYDALDPLSRWAETTGVVTEVKSQASDGDTFIVRFATPDGAAVTVWAGSDKAVGHFAAGERVGVRYRVSDPHDAHIADSPTKSVIAVVVLCGAGVGCVLLARAKNLHRQG
jgi:CubicO group peptidase (beta-lactamase class C family)